jgi:hypothetical protein
MMPKLLPDRLVRERYGISPSTLWRWDRDHDLGFPPAIKIRKRKFRCEQALDEFDKRMAEKNSPIGE